MRTVIAPNGNRMVVYDGHNDPPGWWKHIRIRRRTPWIKGVFIAIGLVIAFILLWWVIIPLLVLKGILGISNAAGRASRRR